MNFIKLIINEIIKIFKKKLTVIFLVLAILSFALSYSLTMLSKNSIDSYNITSNTTEDMQRAVTKLKNELKTTSEENNNMISLKIELLEYAISNNFSISSGDGYYKADIIQTILKEIKNLTPAEYKTRIDNISKLKNLIYSSDFKGYIDYNKQNLKNEFDNNLISKETYEINIENENSNLKYEIGKYPNSSHISFWKIKLLQENKYFDTSIENGYDTTDLTPLTNNELEKLKVKKFINNYRLNNNITPNNYLYELEPSNSYYRYLFDSYSITISMFLITILFIILSTSSISDETTKGTIKFLLITPFKRYEILLSKLLSFILTLLFITITLSLINVIIGNFLFPNTANDYIYFTDKIHVIGTTIYSVLKYILKLPEILIYILLGITLSTTIRNTTIANSITLITYVGSFGILKLINDYPKLNFTKYLPFNNFNLQEKVFFLDNYKNIDLPNNLYNTSLDTSLVILSLTAFLLLVTMFESFNKKDIL